MDLTKTMRLSRDQLIAASFRIADAIGRLTSDFQLGFGSFSDKPTIPFSKEPKDLKDDGKPIPYAFKNHMKLTKDKNRFKNAISNTTLVSNIDSPESGLDAVAQAVLCSSTIGWRNNARKIIFMITDGELHFALDGHLGGIFKKFDDSSCKLKDNTYEKELEFDYPSLGQV